MHSGKPILVAAGATVKFDASKLIGFLCTTSGTISIARRTKDGVTTLVSALPVTAGEWVDIPINLGAPQGRIISSSAIGVLVAG